MYKRFEKGSPRPIRALQIRQILICKASSKQTVTYGQLAQMVGLGGATPLNHMLGHITHYCLQESLPPLTMLVVNSSTGLPSGLMGLPGALEGPTLEADQERVFAFDWFSVYPPTPEQFRQAFLKGQAASKAQPWN